MVAQYCAMEFISIPKFSTRTRTTFSFVGPRSQDYSRSKSWILGKNVASLKLILKDSKCHCSNQFQLLLIQNCLRIPKMSVFLTQTCLFQSKIAFFEVAFWRHFGRFTDKKAKNAASKNPIFDQNRQVYVKNTYIFGILRQF